MTQNEVFGAAKWIAASVDNIVEAPLFRKSFDIADGERATLRIIGLGTFVAYMNGARISDEYFLPLNSEYEKTEFPVEEELTGFRTYVTEYDVTDYLRGGKNTLAVLVGSGWYNGVHYGIHKIYGEKKLIFSIKITSSDGAERFIVSDGTEPWIASFVKTSDINKGESHDYTGWSDSFLETDFDDSAWERVKFSKPVETEYEFTDCPADKIASTNPVSLVYECAEYKIYDAGSNTSGYPVIVSKAGAPYAIKVTFSEGLNPDGTDIDEAHVFWQTLNTVTDGTAREIFPRFTWYGYRYFRVVGDCEIKENVTVHSDIPITSSFDSDSEVLNWTYKAFLHTQLTNMHRGIPSDCPHIERLGYTGDGQNVARSAMYTLGAKKFYQKWIKDISDCQDKLSGRVQYTAPYYLCGGGPGGWGCAIVVVPYEYYKTYGDDTYLRELYPQMLHFFKFLDDHSDANLVTSFKDGLWCLGEWCVTSGFTMPEPFVNTYFYVYSMQILVKIARIIGKEEDIPALEERMATRRKAIDLFYRNAFYKDYTYCANVQGASAFALGIGLGNEHTKSNFIKFYRDLGHYDTGIFGTEIVTRRLFELGEADLAYQLLTAEEPCGFGRWMNIGSTTLREYWGETCRSFSHPMFGAVIALFYEYILGIRQHDDSTCFERVTISPADIAALNRACGHITTPRGKLSVSYTTDVGVRSYTVEIPEGTTADIEIPGIDHVTVTAGTYTFERKM